MRPRIVDYLNSHFHTTAFTLLTPSVLAIYIIMLLSGATIFLTRCSRMEIAWRHSLMALLCGAVAGLFGGHFFYLLMNIGYSLHHPGAIWQVLGNSVSFGVYFFGILGFVAYCRLMSLPLPDCLDVLASVLGIGPMIGRMACFFNGDDYGKLSNLPWAVSYPPGSHPYLDQVRQGLIKATAGLSLPVHPVQLYGSLKGLCLFLLFTFLWKKGRLRPGLLFLLFWIAYPCCRIMLESFRGDPRGFVGPFSIGQYCSMIILAFSITCFFLFYNPKNVMLWTSSTR